MTQRLSVLSRVEAAARRYAKSKLRVLPLYGVTPNGVCTCRKGGQGAHPVKHPVTRNGVRTRAVTYLLSTCGSGTTKTWESQWMRTLQFSILILRNN